MELLNKQQIVIGNCKQCQRPLVRKSKNGRLPKFCNAQCRVKHWRRKRSAAGD